MTPNHKDRAHALLSPSSMSIALKCPASVGLREKIPPSPPNPAAEKGTRIHELGSLVLQSWLEYKKSGVALPDFGEETDELKIAKFWCDVVWKEVFEQSLTGKAWGIEDKLTYSEKFSIWGTADFWMVSTDERAKRFGVIVDLKTGYIPVDVEKNAQLAAYACALRQEIRSQGKDLDYIVTAIYQPFAGGDPYRESTITSKQLDAWEKKFLNLADTVYSGKAKFKAGAHCRFCPAQAHCETYAKTLSKETSLALIDPNDLVFPDVNLIPDSALVKITLYAKALDTFVKSCKKRVLEKLYNGEKLQGIKAVEGQTRRKMDDTKQDLIIKECEKYSIDPFNKKLRGIGELEKDFSAVMEKKKAKTLIDSFTTKGSPPILLVPESDDRPALGSVIDLLNNIETEEI